MPSTPFPCRNNSAEKEQTPSLLSAPSPCPAADVITVLSGSGFSSLFFGSELESMHLVNNGIFLPPSEHGKLFSPDDDGKEARHLCPKSPVIPDPWCSSRLEDIGCPQPHHLLAVPGLSPLTYFPLHF